jgi:hypothetical protein
MQRLPEPPSPDWYLSMLWEAWNAQSLGVATRIYPRATPAMTPDYLTQSLASLCAQGKADSVEWVCAAIQAVGEIPPDDRARLVRMVLASPPGPHRLRILRSLYYAWPDMRNTLQHSRLRAETEAVAARGSDEDAEIAQWFATRDHPAPAYGRLEERARPTAPRAKVSRASGTATFRVGPPENCPICLEDSDCMLETSCSHRFCAPCMEKHLELRKECPMCRQPVNALARIRLMLPVTIDDESAETSAREEHQVVDVTD